MTDNRRIVVTGVQTMQLRLEDLAPPRPGEVTVRTRYAGVCGSDTHAFAGRHPHIPIPYLPGHEAVGVVEDLGPGVDTLAAGDRVTVEPTLPCWDCKQCRSGNENLCERLEFFGCGYPMGGMADRFTVRADRLHRIPDALDDRAAALIEPLATPVHAGRLCGPLADKAVVIIGAGTIGLLQLAVARYAGAARVVVTDPLPAKRRAAGLAGADAVVDAGAEDAGAQVRAALGESADVVFDCVAAAATTALAVDLARKGGVVAIVGVPSKDYPMPMRVIQDEQIRIQGCATYVPADYAAAIEMLAAGAVNPAGLITATFPLEQAHEAFAASASGEHIKVLIEP